MRLVFRLLDPEVARAFYDWMMGLWVFAMIVVGGRESLSFSKMALGYASGMPSNSIVDR
jgi:hypothetical protein